MKITDSRVPIKNEEKVHYGTIFVLEKENEKDYAIILQTSLTGYNIFSLTDGNRYFDEIHKDVDVCKYLSKNGYSFEIPKKVELIIK